MQSYNNWKYFEFLEQLNRDSPSLSSSLLANAANSFGKETQSQKFPIIQTSAGINSSELISTPTISEAETRSKQFKESVDVRQSLARPTNKEQEDQQQDSQKNPGMEDGDMSGVVLLEDASTSFVKPATPEENISRGSKETKGETSLAGAGDFKQWQCDVCKKTFTTKYFLKKHKRLHTGETPYCCGECGKSFTFQQSYHKHVLYHSDEKPHSCSYCGRSFKEMSTLHNHVRIHTGEKPFVCETCGKAFRQRVSYLVHLRIHTGALPYTCSDCGKSFRYKVSLRSHKCESVPKNSNGTTPEQVPSPANNSSSSNTDQGTGGLNPENRPVQHGRSAKTPVNAKSKKVISQESDRTTNSDSSQISTQDIGGHLPTSDNLVGEIQDMDIDSESDMSHLKESSENSVHATYSMEGLLSTNFVKATYPVTSLLTSTNSNTSYLSSSTNDLSSSPINDGWRIPYVSGTSNTTGKSSSMSEVTRSDFDKHFNAALSSSQILDKSNWGTSISQGNDHKAKTILLNNLQVNASNSKDICGQDTQALEVVYSSQMETGSGVPSISQNSAITSKQQILHQIQQQHPASVPYLLHTQQLQEQHQRHHQPTETHHSSSGQLQIQQRIPTSSESTILTLSRDSDEETDLDPESFFKSLFS